MRHIIDLVAIAFLLLAGMVGKASAGSITYNLVDMPAYQNGYTLSGAITTDGTIGSLAASNITSWSVTLTNASFSYSFYSDPGSFVDLEPDVVATADDIYLPSVYGEINSLGLYDANSDMLIWGVYNYIAGIMGYYETTIAALNSPPWNNNAVPVNGSSWVIATASVVPEPSTLILLGIAAVGLAGRFRRKARAV